MILQGDCVERMAELPEASIDAIVCDPPYGLEFMGKEWDRLATRNDLGGVRGHDQGFGPRTGNPTCRNCGGLFYLATEGSGGRTKCRCDAPSFPNWRAHDAAKMQEWHHAWATEALRVLKPGGHLLAFGGTRTYHRLACAIEDAGFEIRDSLIWLYGSGFPKSLDVSKAIDKAAGAEREVVGEADRKASLGSLGVLGASNEGEAPLLTAPATPEAAQWEGWGTALKPGWESIVVARKPLSGTVAQNVLEHGTGALNIDGCRIGYQNSRDADLGRSARNSTSKGMAYYAEAASDEFDRSDRSEITGRWPANVLLSPEAAEELDEQSGEEPSRFFYCAKSGRGERNAGLDGERNVHPTVKPIDLMRWLVRLVTPPGGTVLDPFTGSGTTGIAAALEGFDFIGIEREAEYVAIAEARIAWWSQFPGEDTDEVLIRAGYSERLEREHRESGQLGLLE